MKATLIDMMAALMPFMKPLVFVGAAAFLFGAVALIAHQVFRVDGASAWIAAWLASFLLCTIGLTFILFHFLGTTLGAAAGINIGDFSRMEFVIIPFWMVGTGLILAGALLNFLLLPIRPATR